MLPYYISIAGGIYEPSRRLTQDRILITLTLQRPSVLHFANAALLLSPSSRVVVLHLFHRSFSKLSYLVDLHSSSPSHTKMSKKTHFTTVTPLPAGITRETVLTTLHAHTEMIDLNPLVTERHPIRPPPAASAEEAHCQWYSISDKISYLPGVHGSLTFMGCFHDLPDGLQTHILAPMGLDMKGRWTLGGSLPGEHRQPQELGLGVPKQGLWLKEDVVMKCNFAMTRFVRKTTEKAHSTLVDRLVEKAHIKEGDIYNERLEGASFVSQGSTAVSGAPPGYDHRVSSDVGGLVNPAALGSPRITSFHGSDAASMRSGAGSQHGTSPGLPQGPHPAYTHQQLQQQQHAPASFPPDTKHPYDPSTAFRQSGLDQYPTDTKASQYGSPCAPHPALEQQQRPTYHLQQYPSSFTNINPNNNQVQDPSLYPQPLKSSQQQQQQQHHGSAPHLGPSNFAVELPGGESMSPTELDSGR